jgi:hypothetical protein
MTVSGIKLTMEPAATRLPTFVGFAGDVDYDGCRLGGACIVEVLENSEIARTS